MGRSSTAALIAAVCMAAACADAEAARKLGPGDPVPAGWLPASSAQSGPALVWLFRTEDGLACESLDFSLRRLQRAYGGTIVLGVVHVGHEEHASIPRAFLRSRRISPAAEMRIEPGEFRRAYGDVLLPALIAVRDGRITWSSAAASEPLTPVALDSLLGAFAVATPGSASR